MKKWQKILIRLVALAVMAGIIFFLIISSDRLRGKEPTPTPSPTLTPTPTPTGTPTPTSTPTPSPRPTNTPSPTEPILPYTDVEGINYSNYAGEMAEFTLEDGKLVFGDYGYYTYYDVYGAAHTYRISDWISLDDEVSISEGNWFFGGALETPNYIYAEYDYWGKTKHTLYLRISRTGRNGILVTSMPYNEFDNYRSLTASNEYTFYVSLADGLYSIVQADADGKNPVVLGTFAEGERPFGLWCLESKLVFYTTDGKRKALKSIDLHEQTMQEIVANCNVSDYLYVSGRWAVTGVINDSLNCYNLGDGQEIRIPLFAKEVKDMYYGEPVCLENHVFIQYFNWTGKSGTSMVPVDIETLTAGSEITLSKELSYLCGCDETSLIAEKDAGYVRYDISQIP